MLILCCGRPPLKNGCVFVGGGGGGGKPDWLIFHSVSLLTHRWISRAVPELTLALSLCCDTLAATCFPPLPLLTKTNGKTMQLVTVCLVVSTAAFTFTQLSQSVSR